MKKYNYQAILISADGDRVYDYPRETIEEVEEALADQGSRWYFYAFHAVIKYKGYAPWYIVKRQRLLSVAYPFENFKGRTVASLIAHIESLTQSELYEVVSS